MNSVSIRKILAVIFILIAFVWIWMFFSAKGILVSSSEDDGNLVAELECTYFTGTGFVTKDVIKTDIDLVGSLVCPRIVDLE